MQEVYEVVVFKLKSGVSESDFQSAAKTSQEFLSALPGYVSRVLMKSNKSGDWIDLVTWRSMKDAESAAQQFMENAAVKDFIGMLDMSDMKFLHCLPVPL